MFIVNWLCGSSSRTPTGETIVRRPTTSFEPPFQILLHSGTVRGKLRHLDHHGEFFTSACAEALDHAEEFIVGAPPTRRPPIASWEPRRLLSSTPVPEFICGNVG
jgi:hypothetical protein